MIDNFKLFENTQLARSILRKFGVGENSKTYNDIKELTKDHNGYLGFFVKMWLEQGVSFESLKELYDLIISAPYIRNQGEMKMIQGISSGNSRFYISI
jgi:hypothetical protein